MYIALVQPTEVLAGSAGDLLYVSTFSAFNEDWGLYESQQSARIVDEQLEIEVGAAQTAAWSAASPRFGDFDASVKAVAQQGPVDNAFGIAFGIRDIEDGVCTLPAVILCGIDEFLPLAGAALRQALDQGQSTEYIAFMISSDGYYSLWQSQDGSTKALSAWIASSEISQSLGAENTIRIYAQGSRYRFFINGSRVRLCIPEDRAAASTYAGGECIDGSMQETYQDDTIPPGKLGMIAQSTATGGGGVVVRFDDLIVYSPAEAGSKDARL